MPGFLIQASPEISLADVTADQVQFAHLARLPFRYRAPGLFRFRRVEENIELILKNTIAIERGTTIIDLVCKRKCSSDELARDICTDVLVLPEQPEVSIEALDHLRQGDASKLNFIPGSLQAVHFLNEFTVAYLSCGFDLFGTQCPRLLSPQEYFDSQRQYIAIVRPRDKQLSDAEADGLLGLSGAPGSSTSSHGELGDLPDRAMDVLLPEAFRSQREHVFYEFAVRSRAAREQNELQVALLLGCVALEAVHGALLQAVLEDPLASLGKDREELITNLLREQGFHTLFRLTPMLFLRSEEQPPLQLLERCKKAIEMRNDIMHAKSRRGRYKMRQHLVSELRDAQSAVLKMFSLFESALRRRVPLPINDTSVREINSGT